MDIKKRTRKKNFYLSILNSFKTTTNLSKISNELGISKQNLNYYLRKLQLEGYIHRKKLGWYELTEKCKNMTNHDKILKKDSIRGHAYVWTIKVPQEIKDWDKRIEKLKQNKINFKLIGAKENTPRIKVLGRKVWLCNETIRIYDLPKKSYYGENAIESRKGALNEILLILGVLERKLGLSLNQLDINFEKEHYALIRNDLAIEHNLNKEKLSVADENGEWLLIDDSFNEGGELENVGKSAFKTNLSMKEWWNDNKQHNFKVTPTFVLNTMNGIQQNQLLFAQNVETHIEAIQTLSNEVKRLGDIVSRLDDRKSL